MILSKEQRYLNAQKIINNINTLISRFLTSDTNNMQALDLIKYFNYPEYQRNPHLIEDICNPNKIDSKYVDNSLYNAHCQDVRNTFEMQRNVMLNWIIEDLINYSINTYGTKDIYSELNGCDANREFQSKVTNDADLIITYKNKSYFVDVETAVTNISSVLFRDNKFKNLKRDSGFLLNVCGENTQPKLIILDTLKSRPESFYIKGTVKNTAKPALYVKPFKNEIFEFDSKNIASALIKSIKNRERLIDKSH